VNYKQISCDSIFNVDELHAYLLEQLKTDQVQFEFNLQFAHLETTDFWDQAKANPQDHYKTLKDIASFLSNYQKKKKTPQTSLSKTEHLDDDLAQYISTMKRAGTWGAELEIWAIALKTGYCIKVCHNLKNAPKKKKQKSINPKVDTEYGVSVFGNPSSTKVIKLFFNNSHYMAVNVSNEIINISNQGDCLFSSIAYAIEGKNKYCRNPDSLDDTYRKLAVSQIETRFWEKQSFLNLINDEQKAIFDSVLTFALAEGDC
jgi:hypothetical protein